MKRIIDGARLLLALAILLGFFFGLFMLFTGPLEWFQAVEARSWPFRDGVTTLSEASRTFSSRRGAYWRPLIRGVYADTGETWVVTRVQFGDFWLDNGRAKSEAQVGRFPVGSTVRVYYNPGNPRDIILDPFAPLDDLKLAMTIGIGLFLLPFALYVLGRLRA